METLLIYALAALLAYVNGANDIGKPVASLAGSHVANARHAVLWGTVWTVLGGFASILWGGAMMQTFATGLLGSAPAGFAPVFAVVAGAMLWVLIANVLGLPVSTTHALLGSVVGAALINQGADGLDYSVLANKALLPLLVSPIIAIALCWCLLLAARWIASKVPAWRPGCCAQEDWRRDPFVCADAPPPSRFTRMLWVGLHWLSSGITSFARALNDTPKIAAFLVLAPAFAPSSLSFSPAWVIAAVAVAMGIGSMIGGYRVLSLMSNGITRLDHQTGLLANVSTAALVLAASPLGLPVSTTHVATGSLMGVRLARSATPDSADALKRVLLGWVVTFPSAALLSTAGYYAVHFTGI